MKLFAAGDAPGGSHETGSIGSKMLLRASGSPETLEMKCLEFAFDLEQVMQVCHSFFHNWNLLSRINLQQVNQKRPKFSCDLLGQSHSNALAGRKAAVGQHLRGCSWLLMAVVIA